MYSHFEKKHIYVVVALAEEISKNSCGITTSDLISGEKEVETLDHIPHLRRSSCVERSVKIF